MKKLKILRSSLFFCIVFGVMVLAFADIPPMRLNGSWSKTPLYNDPYKYSKLDYKKANTNPYKIVVKKRVKKNDPEIELIDKKISTLKSYKERDSILRKEYVKQIRNEFDLTEKEKKTAKAYPRRFPNEAKTGKRVYVSNVMKIGKKEYSVNDCRFRGKGDLNGDGVPEIFLSYSDGATHAGARSEIRVFSEQGDFVCYINLRTLYSGHTVVYDYDGDGKVELVYMPDTKDGEYLILGCSEDGGDLDLFKMGGDRGLIRW